MRKERRKKCFRERLSVKRNPRDFRPKRTLPTYLERYSVHLLYFLSNPLFSHGDRMYRHLIYQTRIVAMYKVSFISKTRVSFVQLVLLGANLLFPVQSEMRPNEMARRQRRHQGEFSGQDRATNYSRQLLCMTPWLVNRRPFDSNNVQTSFKQENSVFQSVVTLNPKRTEYKPACEVK